MTANSRDKEDTGNYSDSEQRRDVTSYTVESPDEIWDEWKDTVPRSKRLNDRLLQLIAADVLSQRENRRGIIEHLDAEDIIVEDDIDALIESEDVTDE